MDGTSRIARVHVGTLRATIAIEPSMGGVLRAAGDDGRAVARIKDSAYARPTREKTRAGSGRNEDFSRSAHCVSHDAT